MHPKNRLNRVSNSPGYSIIIKRKIKTSTVHLINKVSHRPQTTRNPLQIISSTSWLTTTVSLNEIPPPNPAVSASADASRISTLPNQQISTSISASADGSHWYIGTFPHWYINQLRNAIFVRSTRGLTTTGYPNVIPPHNPGCFIGTSVHPHIGTLISTLPNQHISTLTPQSPPPQPDNPS